MAICTSAKANWQDYIEKIKTSVIDAHEDDKSLLPIPVLDANKEKSFIDQIIIEYQKQGHNLSRESAALLAGASIGYLAAKEGKTSFIEEQIKKKLIDTIDITELPDFDIEKECKEVASFAGGSIKIENSCLKMEKEAKRRLLDKDIPEEVLAGCSKIADIAGGSYSFLESCVDLELRSK